MVSADVNRHVDDGYPEKRSDELSQEERSNYASGYT